MQKRDLSDNEAWEALLNDTFGGGQTDTPPKKPEPQPAAPAPENTPLEPAVPKKRRLWPFITVVAAILIVAALLLFQPWKRLSPELLMCKNALEQWQSYESYHIVQTAQHYGTVLMSESGHTEYLGTGNDRIRFDYIHRISLDPTISSTVTNALSGYMVKDGQHYHFSSEDSYFPGLLFPWELTEHQEEVVEPWPIYFHWADNKILFREAEYYASGTVKNITVAILEHDPENRFFPYSPYHVIFSFSEKGEPVTITQNLVHTGDAYNAGLSVVTFSMLDANSSNITDAFRLVLLDKVPFG